MIGYLDCSTGISGDKFLGALLDIGAVTESFTAEDLGALVTSIAPEARVTVERVSWRGVAATRVSVEASEPSPARSWPDVRALLEAAHLPAPALARALDAFGELALAEARVHGVEPEAVHFHEVGALDSILDVVGTCAGIEALGIEQLLATPVAVGGGTVATSHGVLPVPAPATAALLVGVPCVPGPTLPDGSPAGELTTPTGAALLRACCDGFGPWPAMLPQLIGYGAGTRDIGSPNVCRLVLGRPAEAAAGVTTEAVTLLESNIDHLSPEAAAIAAEQLLGAGALDAWLSPIVMKKGRSAFVLSALVQRPRAERLARTMIALTGTLGVRRRDLERFVAERDQFVADTPYGPVRFKQGAGRVRPESDDVARVAREQSRAYSDVEAELEQHGIDHFEEAR